MNKSKETKSKSVKVFSYVVGSILVSAAAIAFIPVAIPYISGAINKNIMKIKNAKKPEDDWGPVIEKKDPKTTENKESK